MFNKKLHSLGEFCNVFSAPSSSIGSLVCSVSALSSNNSVHNMPVQTRSSYSADVSNLHTLCVKTQHINVVITAQHKYATI